MKNLIREKLIDWSCGLLDSNKLIYWMILLEVYLLIDLCLLIGGIDTFVVFVILMAIICAFIAPILPLWIF